MPRRDKVWKPAPSANSLNLATPKGSEVLDAYDDLGLFQRFWFPRRELLEVIDEFNDDLQYLASTKRSSCALVGGRSCTCVVHCTSQSLFFFFLFLFFLSFYGVLCEDCNWNILSSFFLLFSLLFSFSPLHKPSLSFVIWRKIMTLILKQ